MICTICGKTIESVNVCGKKYYCPVCYIKEFPPILALTIPWGTQTTLYNPNTNTFELKTISQLQYCGFHLLYRTVYFSEKLSLYHKEFLTFHYRGNFRCRKIRGYLWPAAVKPCTNTNCV